MVGFGIVLGVLLLLMLAVLELNKNTILGFVLLLLVAAAFVWLFAAVLHKNKWYYKLLGWLCFIGCFIGILFLTWPPTKRVPAYEGNTPVRTGVVETNHGQVRGVVIENGAVELYAGVPFAKPPVGELRWREPQDPEPWSGVWEADHFAPMNMQPVNLPIYNSLSQIIGYHDYKISLSDNYVAPRSEDSLYLNIWKPAGDVKDLPVLVYVHGGSLQTGQPWYGDYAGKGLAKQGMVVVNFSYRLGVFGFYADEELAAESPNGTTGNYGLLDQIKALTWVRDNIAAFGGDPSCVTISGESAGAASVSALCTSPLAKGLFTNVILESSTVASVEPPHSFRLFDEAIRSGKELKTRYNAKSVADLRAIDGETLADEAYTQHHITIDGYVLTETPYESYQKGVHNEAAMLHGYNAEESGPFILFSHANLKNYEQKVRAYFKEYADEVLTLFPAATDDEADKAWAQIYGAVFFNYPHYCLNRLENQIGVPVYEYYFSKSNGRLSSWHSGEMIYVYGNIPDGSPLFDENDRALSKLFGQYVKNFAVTGDPNGEGLPVWEISADSRRLMGLGDTVGMMNEKYLALYDVFDRMQGWGD
ncbi:MAG: carboxylesterase family protein [Clostridia bacterium]|nr:carboxylesterase family protein [Clostridia bacterium]